MTVCKAMPAMTFIIGVLEVATTVFSILIIPIEIILIIKTHWCLERVLPLKILFGLGRVRVLLPQLLMMMVLRKA